MTVYLRERPPVHQARQYDPDFSESSAAALTAWIQSANSNAVITVQADEQGFSITTVTDVDGTATVTGVPGDWILLYRFNPYPRVIAATELTRDFEVIA